MCACRSTISEGFQNIHKHGIHIPYTRIIHEIHKVPSPKRANHEPRQRDVSPKKDVSRHLDAITIINPSSNQNKAVVLI
jgi:hypothetical protein